jgi:hypothetical protein
MLTRTVGHGTMTSVAYVSASSICCVFLYMLCAIIVYVVRCICCAVLRMRTKAHVRYAGQSEALLIFILYNILATTADSIAQIYVVRIAADICCCL